MIPFGDARRGDIVTFDDGSKHQITDMEALPHKLMSGPRSSKVTVAIKVSFADRPPIEVSAAGLAPIERPGLRLVAN